MSDAPEASEANLVWQRLQPREACWRRLGQRPAIAWLTGLPGAGKSTLALRVEQVLTEMGRHVMVLDGDDLRHGLNRDLGFSPADRSENVRRTAEAATLLADAGLVVLVALISPYRDDRAMARRIARDLPFLEVFVDAPLPVCETRDPKGLYRQARAGAIQDFTGVSSPYDLPLDPEMTIRTDGETVDASAKPLIMKLLNLSSAIP